MAKHILITGCSSGFGLEAAQRFSRQGHHVHATMRGIDGKNAEAADRLRSLAAAEGLDLDVYEMDVTVTESVDNAVGRMPAIDVVINNAGVGFGGPVESFPPEQILAQFDVNVVGTIRVARAVLPTMRAKKSGLIIQVSSTAGRVSFPGFGVYHASKWGLEGLSESLRYELAPHGIDVVIVEPGPFSTNFFSNLVPGTDTDRAAAYPHVDDFGDRFEAMVGEAFAENPDSTDPSAVVDAFEELIALPNGDRPLRTIAGLDFGVQALNDAVEPIRHQMMDTLQVTDLDGPVARAGV